MSSRDDITVFDDCAALASHVAECAAAARPLQVQGSNSKAFYGNPVQGEPVSLAGIRGITDYAPGELYLTARAATPLVEVVDALAEKSQHLPFDPPQFSGGGTFGGAIAAGLAGTGKPRHGGVRDAILGVQIINGMGEQLTFGGQVMKNVAGYDVSRLMAGSLGTLGIITEATVKVLPRPPLSRTVVQDASPPQAMTLLHDAIQRSLPLDASFYQEGRLYLRLAGGSVDWAAEEFPDAKAMDGDDADFWRQVRDHTLPFFQQRDKPLWRISLPPTQRAAQTYADMLASGDMTFQWNGAVYWQVGGDAAPTQQKAQELGGYACLFRRAEGDDDTPFLPPPSAVHLRLHQNLKNAFDADNILNVGRVYP